MKKLFSLAMVMFLLAVPVQATEVITEEVYHAMLLEYYSAEIEHFNDQGEVTECIAFGDKLFVRYSPDVEDLGTKFLNSLYQWLSDNEYSSVDIYLDQEWFYTLYAW